MKNIIVIRSLIFIFMLVVSVVVIELCLRPFFKSSYRLSSPYAASTRTVGMEHPALGHVLNRNMVGSYQINSSCLRGKEIPQDAEKERILILGDSIPFGWNIVDESVPFPAQLQDKFRDKIVINGGTPGYGVYQSRLFLQNFYDTLNPDVVLLCAGWNDLACSYNPHWSKEVFFNKAHLRDDSKSFNPAILNALRYLKFKITHKDRPISEKKEKVVNRQALWFFKENLKGLIDYTESRSIKLIVLNMPTVLSYHSTEEELKKGRRYRISDIEMFQKELKKVCLDNNVLFVEDFFELTMEDKNDFFIDHAHFSPKGHDRATEILNGIIGGLDAETK